MQSKPVSPKALIARATALAHGGDCGAGLALLHVRRKNLPRPVPAPYDAAIGRVALLAGRYEDAVEFLDRARTAWGGTLPDADWRCLGDALLQLGRIEEAGQELDLLRRNGGKLLKRAHLSAVEAFRQKAGAELDRGPKSPWHILAQAQALADAKGRLGAPKLLAAHRGDWPSVPKQYDAELCRLALRCGDAETAVACLTQARDAAVANVPVALRQALGTALFNAGHTEAAARELSLALEQGATIGRSDFRIAIASHRSKNGGGVPVETSLPRPLTLIDHEHKLVYLSLPKNACTLLKANFVMNTGYRDAYLAAGRPIHEFCGTITKQPIDHERIMGPDYFRFVVLREPLRRVLSAYLDKFVRRRNARDRSLRMQQMLKTIRGAQQLSGLPYDPARSISFAEFVAYLSIADDADFNMHWMPQSRSVGTDLSIFNHVGKMERLQETLDMLQLRFGFVQQSLSKLHMPVQRRHITKFSETAELREPFNALPHELDAFEDGLPMPDLFFTPEIEDSIRRRYAADVALYASA